MTDEQIGMLYDSFDPEAVGLMPFPPADDRGEKTGDAMLAEVILYGNNAPSDFRGGSSTTEEQILFAIRLGKALGRIEANSK